MLTHTTLRGTTAPPPAQTCLRLSVSHRASECPICQHRHLPAPPQEAWIRGAQRRRVCGVPKLLDYTEPEPTRWPRPPKEEGEAARNNVVMSADKRGCPDMICYLLSVTKIICRVFCSDVDACNRSLITGPIVELYSHQGTRSAMLGIAHVLATGASTPVMQHMLTNAHGHVLTA